MHFFAIHLCIYYLPVFAFCHSFIHAGNLADKTLITFKLVASSTLAPERFIVYGMANGLNESWLESLDEGLPKSDMVILLDVTQDESFRRKSTGRDKFESDESFIRKVSRMYKTVAKRKHWKIIDAKMDRKKVHEQILSIVEEKMDC